MTPNELRLNNLVMVENATAQISGLRSNYAYVHFVCRTIPPLESAYRHISGLFVTEELLIEFGFEREAIVRNEIWYSKQSSKGVTVTFRFWPILELWTLCFAFSSEVRFAHQLQNLYFALTGDELNRKRSA